MLSHVVAEEQMTAQTVLELAFQSVKFLACEGLLLRGEAHCDSVFWQLMLKQIYALPAAHEWLHRWDNWMSDSIQNETLELFAHAVQHQIVFQASSSPYYSLIADGTTDVTSREQFSCSLYLVDMNLAQKS